MLQIKDIRKKYVTGDLVQTALDGVSLNLRENEFVAVLGPSGSGKTTLLNVIGGLDRYDSGDLVINGISTKKYSDRDWDSYRNHTIGFVFQSYNLIPHQTVLANVELALTISGVSRAQRRKRAIKALQDVGLGDQLHKKPNQMSGGQMQRVAIARALVNDPRILLADEPTGALDSETSVQIMDLLKEVARDRLVVMVTHNPELAEAYANRIVRVKDGRIIDDTNPFPVDAAALEPPKHKNMGRASMSVWTSLSLSFNNLRTKKARTLLTAFAGSIGIIGIALILSLSTGFQRYIDQIQEDTLASYPLTIQSETANMGAAMLAVGSTMKDAQNVQGDVVLEQQMISQMFAQVGANDLASFKAYLEENYPQVADHINTIQYQYDIKPLIYAADTQNDVLQVNPGSIFAKITGNAMMSAYMDSDVFQELLEDDAMLQNQYEVLRGRLPESWNELVVVLPDAHMLTDYMSYTLGLRDMATLDQMMQQVMNGEEPTPADDPMQWSYDTLMDMRFKLVPASAKYCYNAEYNVWEDMSGDEAYMKTAVENGQELVVVGIVIPKEDASGMMSGGIGYTADLTRRVIEDAAASQIVQSQLADTTIDVFTGKPFGTEDESGMDFENLITVDEDMLSSAFGMNISQRDIERLLEDAMEDISESLADVTAPAQAAFTDTLSALAKEMLLSYIAANADPETGAATLSVADAETVVDSYLATEAAATAVNELAAKYGQEADSLTRVYKPLLIGMITTYVTQNQPEDGENAEAGALSAPITAEQVDGAVSSYTASSLVTGTAGLMASTMTQELAQQKLSSVIAGFDDRIMRLVGNAMYVDAEKIENAFQFNMTEEELRRLMEAMSTTNKESSAASNLKGLGYAELAEPASMSVYLKDFAGKESFMDFIDDYNSQMEQSGQEEQVISYTDVTGLMMSSVRVIIDSVSYVLIAFVAVSLVVSSIMIGIITYISVMERTKEIGVLRAIGASKRNISQVFNAETFIIGLISGAIGIGATLLLIVPINEIIHYLTGNNDISAQLPLAGAVVLVILSVVLTLIGGLIPSKKAAKKDPVIALRSE